MTQQPFDPNQYVSKVKGRDYLEVKWRMHWMRSEQPDAILETELASHENGRAIMRARVTFPNGASATGWGSETVENSEAYIEKAETKAIGRALTALGYGTPLTVDADSAISRDQQRSPQNTSSSYLATPAQRTHIQNLARELNLNEQALNTLVQQHTGNSLAAMNKRQASGIIDMLDSRRSSVQRAS